MPQLKGDSPWGHGRSKKAEIGTAWATLCTPGNMEDPQYEMAFQCLHVDMRVKMR